MAHGEAGAKTLDDVVARMKKDLPEIDRDTVADAIVAFTKRDASQKLTADETKARIAELKRVARRDAALRGQIDSLKKRAAAERRPREKQQYDDRVAALEADRERLRKDIAAERSEARSAETITKEIEDLRQQIATGEFKTKPPAEKKTYSDKITALREERASLRESVSEKKAEIKTEAKLTEEIADLERQFETKEYKAKPPTEKKVYSDKIEALRERRGAAKKKIAAERSAAAAEDRISREIADLEAQVATGEFKARPPSEKKTYTDKMESLRDQRAALRKIIASKKSEARTVENLKKQIDDLSEQLETGNLKGVEPREKKVYSDEIEALKAERSALQKEKAAIASESRMAGRLEKEIADLTEQLETGNLKDKPAREKKVYSDKIEALREQRAELAGGVKAIKAEANFEKRLADQIAELRRKLETGDFAPPPSRAKKVLTDRAWQLQWERDKLKKDLNREIQKMEPRGPLGAIEDVANEIRALMTTGEFSGLGRQGGFLAIGNPLEGSRAAVKMVLAMKGRKGYEIDQMLRPGNPNSHPMAMLAEKAGLHLPDIGIANHGRKSEEAFQTDLLMTKAAGKALNLPFVKAAQAFGLSQKQIDGIGKITPDRAVEAFGRSYITAVNELRFQRFVGMIRGLTKNGEPAPQEAEAIAKFINTVTGRGNIKAIEKQAGILNTLFFAPRYVVSRFETIVEPFRALGATAASKMGYKYFDDKKSMWGGTRETDKAIAREYAKYISGVTLMLASVSQIPGVEIEQDPRSSDFGKIRIGDTRIDMLSGFQQAAVFLAKTMPQTVTLGQYDAKFKSTKTGELEDIDARKFGDILQRFIRSKAAPLPGTIYDLVTGEDVVGDPVKPTRSWKDAGKFGVGLITPITYHDIYKILTGPEYGIPDKMAMSMVALLGAGVQSYDPLQPPAPSDRQTIPKGIRDQNPGMEKKVTLNTQEYTALLQAHEAALAAVAEERETPEFKALSQKGQAEAIDKRYREVFGDQKEAIVLDAVIRLTE